jgi:glycerophosphoryl diester phosphodiesterase
MSLKSCSFAFLLAVAIVLPSRGALLISEVVFNEVGSDVTGEWYEIFNTGPAAVDLTNYKIGDEETSGGTGTGEAVHQFPSGASIAPGQVQIVSVSATTFFATYGIQPTYEVNSTDPSVPDMLPYATWDPDGGVFNMANTNDHALILGPTDSVVDAANWGNNTFLNPGLAQPVLDGQSYQRINAYVDTDTAGDWETVAGATAAQRSTPGTVPIPEPATVVMAIGFAATLATFGRRRQRN